MNMKSEQIIFYFQLGQIATSFAKLEENVRWLLVCLINDQEPVSALYIIEKNTLETNLHLIKKINVLKNFEQELINELIDKLHPLKTLRNSFIHGIWEEPIEKDGEINIEVHNYKMQYEPDKDGATWYPKKSEIYSLKKLQSITDEIQELSTNFRTLLKLFFTQKGREFFK
jgi:hypothetical protein